MAFFVIAVQVIAAVCGRIEFAGALFYLAQSCNVVVLCLVLRSAILSRRKAKVWIDWLKEYQEQLDAILSQPDATFLEKAAQARKLHTSAEVQQKVKEIEEFMRKKGTGD